MKDEALKLALEVNESMKDVLKQINELIAENKALKEALAQPWVDLTKEEKDACVLSSMYHTAWSSDIDVGTLIEVVSAKLREKNA